MSAEDTPSRPQFKSVEKALSLPIVKKGVKESISLYNRPTEWICSMTKALLVNTLTEEAWSKIGPYVTKPLADADERVAAAIEDLERRVPLIKEEPAVIMRTAKDAAKAKIPEMRSAAEPYVQSLNEKSRETGNTLLGYWSSAAQGAGAGVSYAGQWLGQRQPSEGQATIGETQPAAPPGSLWETLFSKFFSRG